MTQTNQRTNWSNKFGRIHGEEYKEEETQQRCWWVLGGWEEEGRLAGDVGVLIDEPVWLCGRLKGEKRVSRKKMNN